MDTIDAHMLSFTNTRGFKFGIPNLIQQIAITERVYILKPNRWEGINIYQKTNPISQKMKSLGWQGRFIR